MQVITFKRFWLFFVCLLLASLFLSTPTSSLASEDTDNNSILAIISDRSASTLVASAHRYLKKHPQKRIDIRTVSQIDELNDTQLQDLVNGYSNILMIAVFGESVERLLNKKYPAAQKRYVFQGDRRLLKLHQDQQGEVFAGTDMLSLKQLFARRPSDLSEVDFMQQQQKSWPQYKGWLTARSYWRNRSVKNGESLFGFIFSQEKNPAAVEEIASIRFLKHDKNSYVQLKTTELSNSLDAQHPIVWVFDHDTGDRPGDWSLHEKICQQQQDWQCISVLAAWGEPSSEAIDKIAEAMHLPKFSQTPWGIVSLQDFFIGGGDARQKVTQKLQAMNVPVLKGIRLTDFTQSQWQLSSQGIPSDTVHYRVAMPELQGLSQAQVLAVASVQQEDALTGAKLAVSEPVVSQVKRQIRRLDRWFTLKKKDNADKKVAIVYYNHPPGRHNIGADNLNVPESLFNILKHLKSEGYNTGELPESAAALLDKLQDQGVNLPEDKQALAAMAKKINNVSKADYSDWFAGLPKAVQAEMVKGPLGWLQQLLNQEVDRIKQIKDLDLRQAQIDTLENRLIHTLSDLHHVLEGVRHKARQRALNLLDQLQDEYISLLNKLRDSQTLDWKLSQDLVNALIAMKIEGIRGWGEAPGKVMVWEQQLLVPGIQFGNIFVGPQPPRGWELNEELLHANMSFPPPHQYLAFYYFLKDKFKADAVVHVGRHSTYEFLPKRSVGLAEDDYPAIVIDDLPSIYPYIVDGVGEGIQAKRRGLAVMVDHLTPPLAITELYDDLLEIRQLVESAEAATDESTHERAIEALNKKIEDVDLKDELIESMQEELDVRGVGIDQVDDHFLLHEVGHYLTHIQEKFMPLGLHTFGKDWQPDAVKTMLESMSDGQTIEPQWRSDLIKSPQAELQSLVNALAGGFVSPGKGNDPIRTPGALPTGRNFYALDGSLLPTKIGYDIGRQLAQQVSKTHQQKADAGKKAATAKSPDSEKQAIILWASDAVRDEGAMIAFGMHLLGVEPIWNSRGIIKGLKRLPLSEIGGRRFDVVFTTSGLFRDLYGEHLVLLDEAILMAIDASRNVIVKDYPALATALDAALEPLGEKRLGGDEPLQSNRVAYNWVNDARQLLKASPNISAKNLAQQSTLRIFGAAPGAYGAGVNRLVERSGAWQERRQIGELYLKRMGHAYGIDKHGEPAQEVFKQQLGQVSNTFLGRASHLYGLMDNNDAFDYLGGLNLAIETLTQSPPQSSVIDHANSNNLKIEPLSQALLSELRGRFLNPQWIKPLIKEGYAGARTIGSEFIEYLWGWQVTSPQIIDDWVWEEVKSVYIDDKNNLGLKEFFNQQHNPHVKTNILAVMLVAIDKDFWNAEPQTTQQLVDEFSDNIIKYGIPGSGHTHAKHPVYDFVKQRLSPQKAAALEEVLQRSRLDDVSDKSEQELSRIQELDMQKTDELQKADTQQVEAQQTEAPETQQATTEQAESSQQDSQQDTSNQRQSVIEKYWAWLLMIAVIMLAVGIYNGRRGK